MEMVEERASQSVIKVTSIDGINGPSTWKKMWKLSKQKQQQVSQTIVLYIGFFSLVSYPVLVHDCCGQSTHVGAKALKSHTEACWTNTKLTKGQSERLKAEHFSYCPEEGIVFMPYLTPAPHPPSPPKKNSLSVDNLQVLCPGLICIRGGITISLYSIKKHLQKCTK